MTWTEAIGLLDTAADTFIKVKAAEQIPAAEPIPVYAPAEKIPYKWIIGGVIAVVAVLLIVKYVR